jgi:chromosome condensin MukBEF complex kleisin-like MukF subunit
MTCSTAKSTLLFVMTSTAIWTLLQFCIITAVQYAMVPTRVYSLHSHLQWVDNLLCFICVSWYQVRLREWIGQQSKEFVKTSVQPSKFCLHNQKLEHEMQHDLLLPTTLIHMVYDAFFSVSKFSNP